MKIYTMKEDFNDEHVAEHVVGINITSPIAGACYANIAPRSEHHQLPVYRRLWSNAIKYEDPQWQRLCGKNPSWCATMYVLYVKPNVENMAVLLGDESLDTICAAALLILQQRPGGEHLSTGEAIEAIRDDIGLVPWQPGRSSRESVRLSCLRGFCASKEPIEEKVKTAADWMIPNGPAGGYRDHLHSAGIKRRESFDRIARQAVWFNHSLGDEFTPTPPTAETLPAPGHFMISTAYAPEDPGDDLTRLCFENAPVAVTTTESGRHKISLHPGALVDIDFDRLAQHLGQMEAAAIAYEKPRAATMRYLARQLVKWERAGQTMTGSSMLSTFEVVEAVWACMLGSKKLPAWRACGQSVKTTNNP